MVDPAEDRGVVVICHGHAVKTADIDAAFIGVAAAAVMRVNPAARTEIMFRRTGIELIAGEHLHPLDDIDIMAVYSCVRRTAAAADRAVTPPGSREISIGGDGDLNRPAMAAANPLICIPCGHAGSPHALVRR